MFEVAGLFLLSTFITAMGVIILISSLLAGSPIPARQLAASPRWRRRVRVRRRGA